MIRVHPVPAFSDNYLWVLDDGRHAVVVDPGDARPVLEYLADNHLVLSAILCTHHHGDHVGGVGALLDACGAIPVYGPAGESIPHRTASLRGGDAVILGQPALEWKVLDVPGHTAGHIAYVGNGRLFCGDTLFGCGCGRIFEGTAAQLWQSLETLADLPGDTQVFCAHEYTLSNIRFAQAVDPGNPALQSRQAEDRQRRDRRQPTLPSTIARERSTNPFLRCREPALIRAAEAHAGHALDGPAAVFATLRQWKNEFK
ncbi:MAG TPA: hydroxyacylglutathione hydrolase [Usitatibacteraceae bacterium]|nr:hydroxyacylglutathione hydrolase [Usitatibacteraceae bacterium]